jgi:DNA modification methylase
MILCGDALDQLRTLPDGSAHMCVTSPPYFGLRSYNVPPSVWGGDADCTHEWTGRRDYKDSPTRNGGEGVGFDDAATTKAQRWTESAECARCGAWRGCLGNEPTPERYVANLVAVFREVGRVLRPDSTLWLVLGDSFANDGKWGGRSGGKHVKELHGKTGVGREKRLTGLKGKDLIGIPWMVAFALRADGWYLRSAITWVKRAPMPESVTDRPTSATEMIFLLSRQPQYFYDAEAVREPQTGNTHPQRERRRPKADGAQVGTKNNHSFNVAIGKYVEVPGGRNLRNAWVLSPEPLSEPHYAAFPSEIPRRAILAGTSEAGCCPACGAPWVRVVKRVKGAAEAAGRPKHLQSAASTLSLSGNGSQAWAERGSTAETTGWRPSCSCDAGPPVPCTALDPFCGSGTTWLVANELGRRFVGIELSPTYIEIAKRRAAQAGFAAAYDAPAVGEG